MVKVASFFVRKPSGLRRNQRQAASPPPHPSHRKARQKNKGSERGGGELARAGVERIFLVVGLEQFNFGKVELARSA